MVYPTSGGGSPALASLALAALILEDVTRPRDRAETLRAAA